MVQLRTPNSTPAVGYNPDYGFLLIGKSYNIDADIVWEMAMNGIVQLTDVATKQLKTEAENADK